MRRSIIALVAALSLLCGTLTVTDVGADRLPPSASSPQKRLPSGEGDFQEGQVIVKFKPGVSPQSALAVVRGLGGEPAAPTSKIGSRLLKVPVGTELRVVEALRSNPNVEYAEANHRCYALLDPDDPGISAGSQWPLEKIRAFQAWDIAVGGDLVIAVVDSGISPTHPDLAGKVVWGARYQNGEEGSDWTDDHGHGTHVAGIAAAVTNNGTGIAGVSWGASLLAVKFLYPTGQGVATGTYHDAALGIIAAVQHGAKVINCSFGGPDYSVELEDAVRYARDSGALVVAAAGNYASDGPVYPAAYEGVVAVGATNRYDQRSWYSNYGPHLWVAAPGGDGSGGVYSTYWTSLYGDGYEWLQGTSMAAPHVSGLAALIWTVNPAMSPLTLRNVIAQTADDLGAPGWDDEYGWGRVNAERAARAVALMVDPNAKRVYVPLVQKDATVQ